MSSYDFVTQDKTRQQGTEALSPNMTPLERIHERLDDIMRELGDMKAAIREQDAMCEPCRKLVNAHEAVINGNGADGLKTRVGKLEHGRTDTVTLKGLGILIASIVTLIGAIGAAIATAIGRG